jgi:endonuclease G, mitochondrial
MVNRVERLKQYLSLITKHRGGIDALIADLETHSITSTLDEATTADPAELVAALKTLSSSTPPSEAELDLAEAIIDADQRPTPLIVNGTFEVIHPLWRKLSDDLTIKTRIERVTPSVGRLELPGDLRRPYGGTGFVVGVDLLMTNRHVAQIFASGLGDKRLVFKPGSRAAIDFLRELGGQTGTLLDVKQVVMIHPYWDMALLRVDGLGTAHLPLKLSLTDARDLSGREIFVIGYPFYDPRNSEADQQQLFGGKFGFKRLQPGVLHGGQSTGSFGRIVPAATHDSSTLGGNSGSAVFDLATGEVLGLHFAGLTKQLNYAVPSFALSRDARVIDAGVRFAGATAPGPNEWDSVWAAADLTPIETTARPSVPAAASPTPQIAVLQMPQTQATSLPPGANSAAGSVMIEVPVRITLELSQRALPAGPISAASANPEQEALVEPFHDTEYASRTGYDPAFLGGGLVVPLPAAATPADLARTQTGATVLAYENFSIAMHATRRLALFTASNVTAEAALRRPDATKSYKRKDLTGLGERDQERWFLDDRLDAKFQLPDAFFTNDRGAFDKGHIVRRDDVAWGKTYDALRRANGDSFHVTNCSPQIAAFNRSANGKDNWGDLENVVLSDSATERLCVFAGPVLDNNDQIFVGTLGNRQSIQARIPSRFWKVIIARTDAGLGAFGFVLEQDLADVQWEFTVPTGFLPARIRLTDIEAMTGVTFAPAVKAADQFGTLRGDEVQRRAGARATTRPKPSADSTQTSAEGPPTTEAARRPEIHRSICPLGRQTTR